MQLESCMGTRIWPHPQPSPQPPTPSPPRPQYSFKTLFINFACSFSHSKCSLWEHYPRTDSEFLFYLTSFVSTDATKTGNSDPSAERTLVRAATIGPKNLFFEKCTLQIPFFRRFRKFAIDWYPLYEYFLINFRKTRN